MLAKFRRFLIFNHDSSLKPNDKWFVSVIGVKAPKFFWNFPFTFELFSKKKLKKFLGKWPQWVTQNPWNFFQRFHINTLMRKWIKMIRKMSQTEDPDFRWYSKNMQFYISFIASAVHTFCVFFYGYKLATNVTSTIIYVYCSQVLCIPLCVVWCLWEEINICNN